MKTIRKSAGILAYRIQQAKVEVFLIHPGGPFWTNKDTGAWSIPKGEFDETEKALDAAIREFKEETGASLPAGNFIALTPIKQKSGKLVYAWAVEADIDASNIQSNSFEAEWPPKSGKWKSFPEVDKAGWFSPYVAKEKINPAQVALIDELMNTLQREA